MEGVTGVGVNILGTEMYLVPIQALHSQNLRYLKVKSLLVVPLIYHYLISQTLSYKIYKIEDTTYQLGLLCPLNEVPNMI